jgi:hypothetical protein
MPKQLFDGKRNSELDVGGEHLLEFDVFRMVREPGEGGGVQDV